MFKALVPIGDRVSACVLVSYLVLRLPQYIWIGFYEQGNGENVHAIAALRFDIAFFLCASFGAGGWSVWSGFGVGVCS